MFRAFQEVFARRGAEQLSTPALDGNQGQGHVVESGDEREPPTSTVPGERA
jgi:hypothetical protein